MNKLEPVKSLDDGSWGAFWTPFYSTDPGDWVIFDLQTMEFIAIQPTYSELVWRHYPNHPSHYYLPDCKMVVVVSQTRSNGLCILAVSIKHPDKVITWVIEQNLIRYITEQNFVFDHSGKNIWLQWREAEDYCASVINQFPF